MATLNPYLNFPGNSEEAFNFYKSIFGGDFVGGIFRFRGVPGTEKLSENELNKVMHIALPVGKGNVLMATDGLESMGHKVTPGNNISLSLEADSKEEAQKLFNGLSEGAEITTPLADAFWGAYFGSLTDKFGIQWMINYTYPKENQ